jgi:hypothetical protein
MERLAYESIPTFERLAVSLVQALLGLLLLAGPVLGAEVPAAARDALAPVTRMIGTLVAIAIGLGIAISGAVIVWGAIEKTMAGASSEAEHHAQRRIANGITGLIWMFVASVIVGTLTAIAAAYGLIDAPL